MSLDPKILTLPQFKSAMLRQALPSGKPEEGGVDVYMKPASSQVTIHAADGQIAAWSEAYMVLCAQNGIPRGDAKYFGVFKQFRSQITRVGSRVGLTVFMNGINVGRSDFKGYGEAIFSHLKGRTVVLGIHNVSRGFVCDGARLAMEVSLEIHTIAIRQMTDFLTAVETHFYNERIGIRSNAGVLIIVHSEGGLVLYKALERLESRIREVLKKHLYIIALAPVHPIPNKFAAKAVNIYSKEDRAVWPVSLVFAKEYHKDSSGYTIKEVDCASASKERILGFIDHNFFGATYQKYLREEIEHIDTTIGIG